MSAYETLKFEKNEDTKIGVLTISRPQALNALNSQVMGELESFFKGIDDTGLRCLIVTGDGPKSFVAGADIKEMKDFGGPQAEELARRGQSIFDLIESSSVPVIAAVNGFALGGGMELALACDFIIASDNAKFGLPEVSLGIMPGYGGTQRLSRHIGRAKARMLAMTGDMFSAQQFYEWGLVVRVTTQEELMENCQKVAASIAAKAPLAVQMVKQAVNQGQDLPQADGLDLEARMFAKVFETEDKNEGVSAFIEKRKADFKGK